MHGEDVGNDDDDDDDDDDGDNSNCHGQHCFDGSSLGSGQVPVLRSGTVFEWQPFAKLLKYSTQTELWLPDFVCS